MQKNNELTQEYIKSRFHYNPETGEFKRLLKTTNKLKLCGWLQNGYVYLNLFGRNTPVHNLIWLYMTGSMPVNVLDHVNRVRSDNRWVNLRHCTNEENSMNKPMQSNNTSGVKGVHWSTSNKAWVAYIQAYGERMYLGSFKSIDDADRAYKDKAIEFHGEFACF